ncbi:hypothetical protein JYT87_02395 [Nitrospira defluvii]|nr:hypothetical protein [Nitrospira defluvii]
MPKLIEVIPGFDLTTGSLGVAQDDPNVQQLWSMVIGDYLYPVTRQRDEIQNRFRSLVSEWKRDTSYFSSITDMATHPAYQRIIGLGKSAIPLILRELQEEPNHWFWALMAITDIDPVIPEHQGRLREMSEDWLQWGREQGYL